MIGTAAAADPDPDPDPDPFVTGPGASLAAERVFSSETFAGVIPDSCVLVRVYVGGAMPAISGLPLVGDVGLVIGVSLVVRPAHCETISCHLAPSL